MTSLSEERDAQRRWQNSRQHAFSDHFERLVANEFLSTDEQRSRANAALAAVIDYVAAHVPYYQRLFEQHALSPSTFRGIDALAGLPILNKWELLEHESELRAEVLPPGETIFSDFKSSGTTGRPTRVRMTARSYAMFTLLTQRHYRWFRFDPGRTLAAILAPETLPRQADGSPSATGVTVRNPRWRYVGKAFDTGPSVAFSRANPLARQIQWLRSERPDYLVSYPGILEEQAFAIPDGPPVDSLKGLMGISSQMTPGMRRRIETSFGIPVHQSYGLNEIGIVAGRCEAGRYHIHAEHCVVEIVDHDGQPCVPGATGRIVVTGLQNAAMPLLRYDTDDTAEVVAGPCACGRTLPSIGEITGRYRRWLSLPQGTRARFKLLTETIQGLPAELLTSLRRYQVHQYRDRSFELRVVTAAALPAGFSERILAAWAEAFDTDGAAFRIVEMDHIDPGPGGKIQEFSSDLIGRHETRPSARAASQLTGADMTLEEPLVESASLARDTAERWCRTESGGGENCAWYHGLWPSLRALGIGTSPAVHAPMMLEALRDVAVKRSYPRVLISGCADYSLFAHVV